MSYYLAPSLAQLRTEINRRWPNRDKTSDGWIGDASHSARKSDHNPDYDDGGVVRAIDVDITGIDVNAVLREVVGDPRVAYVIYNRRISSATDDGKPWDWEPYYGSNPHDKHIHISIKHSRAAETNTSVWFGISVPGTAVKPPVVIPGPTGDLISLSAIAYAARGGYFHIGQRAIENDARVVANWLRRIGLADEQDVRVWEHQVRDDNWKLAGQQYAGLIKLFQRFHGLTPDGIVGPVTSAKLKQHLNRYNYRVTA
jgi:hypothetical protein